MECLKPEPSDKLDEIGLALLKWISSHRGLTFVPSFGLDNLGTRLMSTAALKVGTSMLDANISPKHPLSTPTGQKSYPKDSGALIHFRRFEFYTN